MSKKKEKKSTHKKHKKIINLQMIHPCYTAYQTDKKEYKDVPFSKKGHI